MSNAKAQRTKGAKRKAIVSVKVFQHGGDGTVGGGLFGYRISVGRKMPVVGNGLSREMAYYKAGYKSAKIFWTLILSKRPYDVHFDFEGQQTSTGVEA